MKPWDQQPNESDAAYKAFKAWRDSPHDVRELSPFMLVLRDSGIQFSEETIRTYRRKYKWMRRTRAYENWLRRKAELRISAIAAKNTTLILEKRSESTLKAVTMALTYLDQLPQVVTEDAVSRTIANVSNALDAVRKVMEAVGLGCVDAEDLREELEGLITRKAKKPQVAVRNPDPEDLLGLSDESGTVQSGSPETSGVLDATSADMQGRGESGDSDGSSPIG